VLLADVWQGKELFGIRVGTAEELNAETRSAQRFRGEEAGRGCVAANTGKNSTEVHGMSIYLLGIIRMDREVTGKAGVEELMSGVQGMELGTGKRKILTGIQQADGENSKRCPLKTEDGTTT
jgi:hypothetical protein